jgi:threonyl-tRNA synthetase
VRNRDDVGTKARGTVVPLDTIAKQLLELKTSRTLENKLAEAV